MKPEEYGDYYHKHLLSQYRLYVEMMDRVSKRRVQNNVFFMSIVTGLIALISFIYSINIHPVLQPAILVAFSFLGLLFSYLWFQNIQEYKTLNSGKCDIIHKMEKNLPFECYKEEWDVLQEKKYKGLTTVEKQVAGIMAMVFVLLIVIGSLLLWIILTSI